MAIINQFPSGGDTKNLIGIPIAIEVAKESDIDLSSAYNYLQITTTNSSSGSGAQLYLNQSASIVGTNIEVYFSGKSSYVWEEGKYLVLNLVAACNFKTISGWINSILKRNGATSYNINLPGNTEYTKGTLIYKIKIYYRSGYMYAQLFNPDGTSAASDIYLGYSSSFYVYKTSAIYIL